jgi:hypothetical protein
MTNRNVILYSLMLPVALSLTMVAFEVLNGESKDSDGPWFTIIILFVLWAIGIVIGLILSAIVKKPHREPYFYLSGQIIIIAVIAFFIIHDRLSTYKHERDFGNVEYNHDMVDYDSTHPYSLALEPSYIRAAFKKLEEKFTDPNDFKLRSYKVVTQDTAWTTGTDRIYFIYFTYNILNGQQDRFSKVRVYENNASIEIFNSDPETDAEYQRIKRVGARERKEVKDAIKNATDMLRDSLKKRQSEKLTPQ